jgi:competence protein ComEA
MQGGAGCVSSLIERKSMLKKILVLVAMLYAAASFAAVDVNKASAAELDAIKGIGPGISTKILDERKKGNFKDWPDLIDRVKGVGEGNAAKFSNEGLTVGGSTYKGAPAAPSAPVAKKDEKPMVKADAKPSAGAAAPVPVPAPAPAAAPAAQVEKADPKAQAKAKKEADKKAKAEEKQKKADGVKAKKDAAKQAKEDAKKAKDEPKK